MEYSNDTTKSGIIQEIDFLLNLDDSTTYDIKHKTRNVNRAYDRVVSLILQTDNRWEWEDTNKTDLPIATTDLVAGQRDYGIDITFLRITKLLVKDRAGNWQILIPVDENDPEGRDIIEEEEEGVPQKYIKKANSIFLDPKPNYSSTAGLKIHFQRNADYFTSDDTSKKPGFAEPFHRLLSLYAAYDWCLANNLAGRIAILANEIAKMEAALIEFYSSRARDEKPRIRLRKEIYG